MSSGNKLLRRKHYICPSFNIMISSTHKFNENTRNTWNRSAQLIIQLFKKGVSLTHEEMKKLKIEFAIDVDNFLFIKVMR